MKSGEKFIFTFLMSFEIDKIMGKIVGVKIEKEIRFLSTQLIN